MTGGRSFSVVPLGREHRDDWDALFAAYADFYGSAQSPAMREAVWGWLHDDAHELRGLVALDASAQGVGIAHYRPFSRPLAASVGGFLDDLFVRPDWRGRGVAEALIEAVAADGRRRGWSVIRWITAQDNGRARALYRRVADETGWVTYQIPL